MPPNTDHPPSSFPGFDKPEQNWFKMPNYWTDITAQITSLAELKVIEYVLKHTWGYQEYGQRKLISNDEFMHGRRRKDGTRLDLGTGLSKPSVIAGLKAAVEHGFLIEEVDASDKARVKKYYFLRMVASVQAQQAPAEGGGEPLQEESEDLEAEDEAGVKHLNAGVKNLYRGVKKVDPRGKEPLPRSEQDTLERHQQTDTTSNTVRADDPNGNGKPAADVVVALSSQGVSKSVAEKLVREHDPRHIGEKIAFLEFLLEERPTEIKRPAAWLRRAIEDDYEAPDGFVTAEERERQAEAEKRRKQADLEALQRQREQVEEQHGQRERELRERRDQLDKEYKTTSEDTAFWETVQHELRYGGGMGLAEYSLIADAEILSVSDETVRVGVFSKAKYQDLQHPALQKRVKQALKHVAGHSVEIEILYLGDSHG